MPGIALYKAINTADSMIGHRTPRHLAFGWAAARLDDLVNLPASRLTALLIIAAAALDRDADAASAWRAVRRDARRHRSPNAGWPEAAMAGALGLRLAGPRVYGDVTVDDGWMGDGRAEPLPPISGGRCASTAEPACFWRGSAGSGRSWRWRREAVHLGGGAGMTSLRAQRSNPERQGATQTGLLRYARKDDEPILR